LDLLGFIRPNPDFSMGYGQKNKKIFPPSRSPLAVYLTRCLPLADLAFRQAARSGALFSLSHGVLFLSIKNHDF
jgi:hypothetical protein